ncbi:hypothetical protein [Paenibacillus sp. 8b26]
MDRDLLKQRHLTGLDDIMDEIQESWPSLEAYENNGFGCAAMPVCFI